ncbi:MAG: YkgJ family cysteine cluster protein [Chloroflexota bacterium]
MPKSWKETILGEYPRLSKGAKFRFSCHKGLSCYTQCCGDVNIFLTPYDVLRMKQALNLSSEEFLDKYTIPPVWIDLKLPMVLLKMRDDDRKSCPFVAPEGCSIYDDRPWPCRMFPLGLASSKTTKRADGEEFCFVVEEGFSCLGLKEDKEWTVAEWWRDQEIDLYEKKGGPYKDITLNERFREGKGIGPSKAQMFFTACYDLDRFRRLLFDSSFFNRFDVPDEVIEKMKTDDEALLDFGFDWLRFSLFGEDTLRIKGEVAEAKKRELGLDSVE